VEAVMGSPEMELKFTQIPEICPVDNRIAAMKETKDQEKDGKNGFWRHSRITNVKFVYTI
jgi:hypothetical protein